MTPDEVAEVLDKPLARSLMAANIPARLAYTGLDGAPRVVPVGTWFTGTHVVVGTTPKSYKVRVLTADPRVALTIDTTGQHPPRILFLRGTASLAAPCRSWSASGPNARSELGYVQRIRMMRMRTLVITENITVDRCDRHGRRVVDPLRRRRPVRHHRGDRRAQRGCRRASRRTQHLRGVPGFWPKQTDDPTGVSKYLNGVDKYVVSSTIGDPGWRNSTVLRGPLADEVRALKQAPGRDIVATGSVRLVHALIAHDLVDEYRLFVFPVVVGRGARLFESADARLELAQTRPFRSGAVLLRYGLALVLQR